MFYIARKGLLIPSLLISTSLTFAMLCYEDEMKMRWWRDAIQHLYISSFMKEKKYLMNEKLLFLTRSTSLRVLVPLQKKQQIEKKSMLIGRHEIMWYASVCLRIRQATTVRWWNGILVDVTTFVNTTTWKMQSLMKKL